MFPLRDNIPTLHFPLLTVLLIIVNVAVFAYEKSLPADVLPRYGDRGVVAVDGFEAFTAEWGFVPCELTNRCQNPDGALLPTAGEQCCVPVEVPSRPAV